MDILLNEIIQHEMKEIVAEIQTVFELLERYGNSPLDIAVYFRLYRYHTNPQGVIPELIVREIRQIQNIHASRNMANHPANPNTINPIATTNQMSTNPVANNPMASSPISTNQILRNDPMFSPASSLASTVLFSPASPTYSLSPIPRNWASKAMRGHISPPYNPSSPTYEEL